MRFARSIGARITGFIAEPEVVVPNLPGFVGREAGAGGGPRVKPRLHAQPRWIALPPQQQRPGSLSPSIAWPTTMLPGRSSPRPNAMLAT